MSINPSRIFAGCALGLMIHLSALAETTVLLTIDTETRLGGSAREDLWGELPNNPPIKYGVPFILDLLKRHQAKATFFVTPYEYVDAADIKDVTELIKQSDNSVQLHTHPAPMYGRLSMSSYDVATQREILEKGKQMLESWSGETIVVHRAGAYSANHDTLDAAEMAGITADASLAPAVASPLFTEGATANDVTRIKNIIELPVTYYAQIRLFGFESLRELDIESSTEADIKKVISQMASEGACTVNIMMHSFSFTRHGKPDERIINRLENILEFISKQPNLRIATVPEFLERYNTQRRTCNPAVHFVPVTGVFLTYLRAWERLSEGGLNIMVALGPPLTLFLLMMVFVGRTLRRR